MLSRNASIVLMSLAGAGLIHLALACSSGSASVRGLLDGSAEAHADTPAVAIACARWEVQSIVPTKFVKKQIAVGLDDQGQPNLYNITTFDAFTLPDGWEPIGGGGLAEPVIARHCLQ